MKRFVAIVVLTALAPLAAAQQKSARPDPADPAASVPPVKYESTFTGYVPFREQALAPWREVNDEVGRVGGHVGMFGGAGHATQGAAKPVPIKPAAGQPAAKKEEPAGRPPVRGTTQSPQGGHKGH